MNYFEKITKLKNRYFLMRHGESEANRQELVISAPSDGVHAYGLTPLGKQQAFESASKNKELDKDTIIYASDFLRTQETAKEVQKALGTGEINTTIDLRERYFGEFEGKHHSHYPIIFKLDEKNPEHTEYQVESVMEVLERTSHLVYELEKQYNNEKILLVSHGDPLHILHAGFIRVCPSTRLKYLNLKNAQIHEVHLKEKIS